MVFEWDDAKSRANRTKHGIDFEFARLAFDDPFSVLRQDRDVDGEQRYQLIGAVFTRLILVAHAVRVGAEGRENSIRIISARKASPGERVIYEDDQTN